MKNGGIFHAVHPNKAGTGTAFHKHGNTFLGLISGRKRVFLYPPYIAPIGGYPPSYSSFVWFHNVYRFLDQDINETVEFDFNDIERVYHEETKLLFDKLLKMESIEDILSNIE